MNIIVTVFTTAHVQILASILKELKSIKDDVKTIKDDVKTIKDEITSIEMKLERLITNKVDVEEEKKCDTVCCVHVYL